MQESCESHASVMQVSHASHASFMRESCKCHATVMVWLNASSSAAASDCCPAVPCSIRLPASMADHDPADGWQQDDDPPRHPVDIHLHDDVQAQWMVQNDAVLDEWFECDSTWHDPIWEALNGGALEIELPHVYLNYFGEQVKSIYTIDLRDLDNITQTNKGSGKVRPMALWQRMMLVQTPGPPPGEPPAEEDDDAASSQDTGAASHHPSDAAVNPQG